MIRLENISFSYSKRKKPIFEEMNLDLEPGSIYGLLGKNGAGKSTLLKHITGLSYPDRGKSQVLGFNAVERDPRMLRDIYLIPEEFDLPSLKVSTYIRLNAPFYPAFSREQLARYLDEFDLTGNPRVSDLSYGQKKKFLISFGLATNARLLILDEPTNGLDIPSKSRFRKIMAGSLDEDKLILISTHQVRDLENLIDHIVILEEGKVIFRESLDHISEKMQFVHNLHGIAPEEVIYSEELPGRNPGIIRNRSQTEGRVDLELLFNGVIKQPEMMNRQFTKTGHEAHGN